MHHHIFTAQALQGCCAAETYVVEPGVVLPIHACGGLEATDRGLLGSSAAPSSPSSTGTRNFFFKLPSISNMDCMLWLVFIRLPPRDVAGSFWSPSQLVLSRSSWSKLKSSPPGSARGKGCTCGSHRVLITAWHGCARAACKRHKAQQGLPYGLGNNV